MGHYYYFGGSCHFCLTHTSEGIVKENDIRQKFRAAKKEAYEKFKYMEKERMFDFSFLALNKRSSVGWGYVWRSSGQSHLPGTNKAELEFSS